MAVSDQRHAPSAFYSRYPLYRRLGGPQSRSGHRGYRKILCPRRGSNLDRPVVQPVARHYTAWATGLISVNEVYKVAWEVCVLHQDTSPTLVSQKKGRSCRNSRRGGIPVTSITTAGQRPRQTPGRTTNRCLTLRVTTWLTWPQDQETSTDLPSTCHC
jgi:hypothetical protein